MKNVTIADVAHAAGVSVTTVSRYLNGNYKKMSPSTKQNIEKTIANLHYLPKTSARRMRQAHSRMVGVIVADISNVFSSLLFRGIYDVLQPAGYDVILMNSNNDIETESAEIKRLLSQQVDGIILQPNSQFFRPYQLILDTKVPLITVDRTIADQPNEVTAVKTSNFDATNQLAEKLIQKGYTNIISFSRTLAEISAQKSRIAGLESAITARKISYTNIETANMTPKQLKNTIRQLVDDSISSRTAVISLMGPLLFDLLQAFKENNLHFPNDLGLISFDDWTWSKYVNSGIYLLQQQPDLMGQTTASSLLEQITHHVSPGGIHFTPVKFVPKPSI